MSLLKFLVINGLTWFLVLAETLFPVSAIRIGIGVPFLLFFPGYALLNALSIQSAQRVFLSIPLSMLTVTLIGFGLNYTPWGITLDSVIYAVGLFTTASLFVAAVRYRFTIGEMGRRPAVSEYEPAWAAPSGSVCHKALFAFALVIAFAAITAVTYFIGSPKTGEEFTQFTVASSPEGNTDFPNTLSVNQTFKVYVSVFNHEGREVNYTLNLKKNGEPLETVSDIVLADGQTQQQPLDFALDSPGPNQKIEISLLKDGQPYLSPLYLWFDVAA